MHKIRVFILALTFLSQPLFASAEGIRGSLLNDLAQTYGFCSAQRGTIEKIQRQYPELANSAARAQLEFDLVFKRACQNVEAELKQSFGEEWTTLERKFDQQMAILTSSQLQQAEATSFIDEVGLRAKGQVQSPFLQILLSRRPDFQSNPANEVLTGFKDVFRSKN